MQLWEPILRVGGLLVDPFVNPASRTFALGLAVAALIAVGLRSRRTAEGPLKALTHGAQATLRLLGRRSSLLDLQLLVGRQLLRGLGLLTALAGSWYVATRAVMWLDSWLGSGRVPAPAIVVSIAYTLCLFVAWDFSRYALHRLMHSVPALWAFHQVHHSATVLTPLTFHRIHPVESLLYQVRDAVVAVAVVVPFFWLFRGSVDELTFFGVHIIGFLLNTVMGNLRHSHVWWRFPPAVERWFISPAQHQLHHSLLPAEHNSNYGTWLAIWDRRWGSLRLSPPSPPVAFGLDPATRNHGDNLASAWFGPFWDVIRRPFGGSVLAAALVVAGPARADGPTDEVDDPATQEGEPEADTATASMDIIVEAEQGVPQVAGSAHLVDEATLEQFEYDDIHRVVAQVPGVYVRGEDGFGLRPNIGIRGASSERSAKLTLLEDGIPFTPAPYAAPAAYYFPQTTRMVGVEVFKGPAATQHGPNTIGGAINLRTRRVPLDGFSGGVDLAGGTFATFKGHGWAGYGTSAAGFLVEAVQLHSGGFKELDTGGPTGFDRTELMAKGRVRLTEGRTESSLDLKLGFSREDSTETYLGLHRDDWEQNPWRRYAATDLGHMQWMRSQAELGWDLRVGGGFQLRTVAYHHYFTRSWTKFNRFAEGPDPHDLLQAPDQGITSVYLDILRGDADSTTEAEQLLIGTNDRRYHAGGVQSLARWEIAPDQRIGARGEAAVRLHIDDVARLHTEDAYAMRGGQLEGAGNDTVVNTERQSTAWALATHTHWDVRVGPLHIEPGVRVELVRTTDDDLLTGQSSAPQLRAYVMPGVGFLVNLGDSVDVFAGAHRGFSPVSPGQPVDTRPELAWNYELGARAAALGFHGDVAGFLSDYNNLTGQCSVAAGCDDSDVGAQYNAGKVWVAGVEMALGYTIPVAPGLQMPVSGTYTGTWTQFRSSFTSSFPQFGNVQQGDRLPYIPAHQGGLRLGLEHERFKLHFGAELRSGMLDSAGTELTDSDVPALFLLDAAAHVRVWKQLWLYSTANNLTGAKTIASWRPAGIRPVARTSVMIGVKLRTK